MTAPIQATVPEKERFNLPRGVAWLARAISYLLYFYILLVEIVLFIGFFLLLFGANPSSSFTQWAYRNLESAMEPFRGIFSSIEIGVADNDVPAIFETSILFAMIMYAILAIALNTLIDWLTRRINRIDREVDYEHAKAVAEAQALARYQAQVQAQAAAAAPPEANLAAPAAPAPSTAPARPQPPTTLE